MRAFFAIVGLSSLAIALCKEMSSKNNRLEPIVAALKSAHGGDVKNVSNFDSELWKSTFKVLDEFSDVHGVIKAVGGLIGVDRSTLSKRFSQRASSDFGVGRKPQVPKFFQKDIADRLQLSADLWRAEPRVQGLLKMNKATIAAGYGPVSMRTAKRIAAIGGIKVKDGEATGTHKAFYMAREKIDVWYSNMEAAGVGELPPSSIFNMDEHDLNPRAKKHHAVSLAFPPLSLSALDAYYHTAYNWLCRCGRKRARRPLLSASRRRNT